AQCYGVPAPAPAFVYSALGQRPLPTKQQVVADAVDSIAARFNLRYNEQKWVNATIELITHDPRAREQFMAGDLTIFTRGQFTALGGLEALRRFSDRERVFAAVRAAPIVRQSMQGGTAA